jgi:putative ABC transport system permease protein
MAGDVSLEVSATPLYLAVYALLAILVGLVSGLVPAWMASHYKPVEVIKGKQRQQTKSVLSKVFIIIQNVITVTLISLALVMELQYHHMLNMPLGADVNGLYFLSSGTVGKDVLAQKPYVDRIGSSSGYPGKSQMTMETTVDGNKIHFGILQCDETAFDMFDFQVVKDFGTPRMNALWFTESAARIYSLDEENPVVPDAFKYVTDNAHIGGIIKDYAVKGPSEVEGNQIGVVSVVESTSTVILKLNRFDAEVRSELKEIDRSESLRMTGDEEYGEQNFGYIPELIEKGMEKTRNFISLIELFMLLATLISLLGLVAMSTYYTGMQTRNIAIRKVFGGTVTSETVRSVREYMILVGIAILIGIPLAIFLSERYLRQFWYRIENYEWVFIVGAVIALIISFLAVLWQTQKAARTNPAVELKKE